MCVKGVSDVEVIGNEVLQPMSCEIRSIWLFSADTNICSSEILLALHMKLDPAIEELTQRRIDLNMRIS